MGSYLNPGNKGFCESLNSAIYVDKSGLIEKTNALINNLIQVMRDIFAETKHSFIIDITKNTAPAMHVHRGCLLFQKFFLTFYFDSLK